MKTEDSESGLQRQRASVCQLSRHPGLRFSGFHNQGPLVSFSVIGSHPWCRSCHPSDTCAIRTHAGRPHRLSRPTPWPLGQSVNAAMETGESATGMQAAEELGLSAQDTRRLELFWSGQSGTTCEIVGDQQSPVVQELPHQRHLWASNPRGETPSA